MIDEWHADMKEGSNIDDVLSGKDEENSRNKLSPEFPVYAKNFTIPAMGRKTGKTSITRRAFCNSDSIPSALNVTRKDGSSKVIYTSKEDVSVSARIWFYGKGNSSSCTAQRKLLQKQGKIF